MNILPSLIFLVVLITFCVLQAYICKNAKNKKLGLILPIGSFLIGTMPIITIVLSFILSFFSKGVTNYSFVIITSIKIDFLPDYIVDLISLIILFIMIYLPTIIFTSIYLYYKNKNKQEDI